MARGRVVGRARVGKKIDFKSWSFIPAVDLASAAAQTIAGSFLQFAIPATILRMRGEVLFLFDSAPEAASITIAMGIGVVSTDAANAGVGSLPDPAGEPDYPWLYWKSISLLSQTAGTAAEQNPIGQAFRLEVDSKAMRKIKPGQSLVVIYQTTTAVAVDILQAHTRVLIGT